MNKDEKNNKEQDDNDGIENIIDKIRNSFKKKEKDKDDDDDSLPPIGLLYGLMNDKVIEGLMVDKILDNWQKKKKRRKKEEEE